MVDFTQLAAGTPPAIPSAQDAPLQTERIGRAARGGAEVIAAISKYDAARQRTLAQQDIVRQAQSETEFDSAALELFNDSKNNDDITHVDTPTEFGLQLGDLRNRSLEDFAARGGQNPTKLRAELLRRSSAVAIKFGQYITAANKGIVDRRTDSGVAAIVTSIRFVEDLPGAQDNIRDVVFESGGSYSPGEEDIKIKAGDAAALTSVFDYQMAVHNTKEARRVLTYENAAEILGYKEFNRLRTEVGAAEYDAEAGIQKGKAAIANLAGRSGLTVEQVIAARDRGDPNVLAFLQLDKGAAPKPTVAAMVALYTKVMGHAPSPEKYQRIQEEVFDKAGVDLHGDKVVDRARYPFGDRTLVERRLGDAVYYARKLEDGTITEEEAEHMDIVVAEIQMPYDTGQKNLDGTPVIDRRALPRLVREAYQSANRPLPILYAGDVPPPDEKLTGDTGDGGPDRKKIVTQRMLDMTGGARIPRKHDGINHPDIPPRDADNKQGVRLLPELTEQDMENIPGIVRLPNGIIADARGRKLQPSQTIFGRLADLSGLGTGLVAWFAQTPIFSNLGIRSEQAIEAKTRLNIWKNKVANAFVKESGTKAASARDALLKAMDLEQTLNAGESLAPKIFAVADHLQIELNRSFSSLNAVGTPEEMRDRLQRFTDIGDLLAELGAPPNITKLADLEQYEVGDIVRYKGQLQEILPPPPEDKKKEL